MCTSDGISLRACATISTPVEVPAAVTVAVDRKEHLGGDLPEPVDDRPRPEVRRARGPDRADARACEQPDHGLLDVGEVRRHPVAPRDAECAQARRRGGGPRTQLGPARARERPELGRMEERGRLVLLPVEDVPRVAELGACKPLGAGHPSRPKHRAIRARRGHAVVSQIEAQNASRSATDQRQRSA